MLNATDIRVGDHLRIDSKSFKVLSSEIKGTGKFGKTIHLKLRCVEDGSNLEQSLRAEDKVEDIEVRRIKMQYLYREKDGFVFMNSESYEQFTVPAVSVGPRDVFLKENSEIDVLFADDKILSIDFPGIVELKVTVAPPGVKDSTNSTYKEVELENGLKLLVPQFIKEGEAVRVDVEELAYKDRVTTKSMKRDK